jgi:hypothetical protein
MFLKHLMRSAIFMNFIAVAVVVPVLCIFSTVAAVAQSDEPYYQNSEYSMWPTKIVEGSSFAEAKSREELSSNYSVTKDPSGTVRTWKLHDNLDNYPKFRSPSLLADAVYNLSLSELKRDTTSVGTFDAGAQWPGVWTRDASYSILLSLAAIDPQTSKASLLKKVNRDRIIQDTGTGGSWPVSTDSICWSLAAWEVYLVTGDREWLAQSEKIIENSIRDDEQVVMDPVSGLARGESSFLDWREQTYPRWMQPADIYASEDLSTNAVFYRAYTILDEMNRQLGKPTDEWSSKADRIRNAINNRMWIPAKGHYGQYLYGRAYPTLSPRSDALGQALVILFDIPNASQRKALLKAQPFMPFGVPTVYPETPGIRPYHNRSVWPFVQSFWNLAAARQGDEALLTYGLASMYRATALFLTNKENYIADTGSPAGTAVNSDRQLWSVAGSLSMVYRVFIGMSFAPDGLHFHPFIPKAMRGKFVLTNFHYRGSVLSISVQGFGNHINRVTIDGQLAAPMVPATLAGDHSVSIEVDEQNVSSKPFNIVRNQEAPDTPSVEVSSGVLIWNSIPNASGYAIYRNGDLIDFVAQTRYTPNRSKKLDEYQVMAEDTNGNQSFLSVPVLVSDKWIEFLVRPLRPSKDTGPVVELTQDGATGLTVRGVVPKAGKYFLVFRYANGSGGIDTGSECAIRTLFIDGHPFGPIVLPQRGAGKWDAWGISSPQKVQLEEGPHTFELRLLPSNLNMNGMINRVLISSLSIAPIS